MVLIITLLNLQVPVPAPSFSFLPTYIGKASHSSELLVPSQQTNVEGRRIQLDGEDMQWYENLSILLGIFSEVNVEARLVFNRMW